MADHPGEGEIKQIFKRLVSIPTNKQCFDCSHSNPTWASITYGVFLCIDCSAVHRSLGVHVTFIRSTQLDTNWTWLQLRAMQVGGNANARAFFSQHGCSTTDAQNKYHSRAATLYRDKVLSLAQHAMRLHGTKLFIDDQGTLKGQKLHIESHHDPTSPEAKEVDFFSEHTQDSASSNDFNTPIEDNARLGGLGRSTNGSAARAVNGAAQVEEDPSSGPSVEAALSTSPSQAIHQAEPRKALIGAKKAPAGKKGKGLGAQRVKKDFNEIENRAQQVDKEKEEMAKNIALQEVKTKEDQDKQMANMRLAYQDMSLQRKKEEEKWMKNDPKKAEQFERLGMGFAGNKGISHSAISDMQTIKQESPSSGSGSSSSRRDFDVYGEKPRGNKDFFDDEFEFVSKSSWSSPKNTEDKYGSRDNDRSGWGNKNRSGGWDSEEKTNTSENLSQKSSDSCEDGDGNIENAEEDAFVVDNYGYGRSRKAQDSAQYKADPNDAAQKKFGNAKAISSDQYFGNQADDFEMRQNYNRVQGQSSISSEDFFGTGGNTSRRQQQSYNAAAAPDLQDIKDGVKQGVTKVAGKISSLANGVMSSLQEWGDDF